MKKVVKSWSLIQSFQFKDAHLCDWSVYDRNRKAKTYVKNSAEIESFATTTSVKSKLMLASKSQLLPLPYASPLLQSQPNPKLKKETEPKFEFESEYEQNLSLSSSINPRPSLNLRQI